MKEIKSIRLEKSDLQLIELIKIEYFRKLNVKLNTSEVIRSAISVLYNNIKSNK